MEISIQDIVQHAGLQVRAVTSSDIIAKHGNNTIVLFQIGNQYEAYNESAEQLHTICEFPIIHHGNITTLEFNQDCDFWVFPKMIREGYKICVMEKEQY